MAFAQRMQGHGGAAGGAFLSGIPELWTIHGETESAEKSCRAGCLLQSFFCTNSGALAWDFAGERILSAGNSIRGAAAEMLGGIP